MVERLACPRCGAVFRQKFGRCPLDATPLAAVDHDPLVGITLADRYVIETCAGEGGMGRVYRARHRHLDSLLAVKVLYGDLAADTTMRRRFTREAKAASRLDHPNLVSVIDFGTTDLGLLYLVMSFVEGRELEEIIEQDGPLAPERIIRLVRQLCAGLGHAHDQGWIHRDFKGQNVIVTGAGESEQARILDFGLAYTREPQDGVRLTTEGMVMGTPAYMSPEQATRADLDHRTDLFSLGVLLYEMLSGVLPFDGTPAEIARQNLAADPPPISERVPDLAVDPGLESIARRLMEKRPDDRFQSAHEVIAALDMLAAGDVATQSLPALPATPPTPAAALASGDERRGSGGPGPGPAGGSSAEPGSDRDAPAPGPRTEGRDEPGQVTTRNEVDAFGATRGSEALVTTKVREHGRGKWLLAASVAALAVIIALLVRGMGARAPVATEPDTDPGAAHGGMLIAAEESLTTLDATGSVMTDAVLGAPNQATTPVLPAGSAGTEPDQPEAARRQAAQPEADQPEAASLPQANAASPRAGSRRDRGSRARGSRDRGEDGETRRARQAAAPSVSDLVTLYERVGEKLARLDRERGSGAAGSLWNTYRSIPLADALRTPSLGQEAMRKLRRIEKSADRALSAQR